MIWFKGYEKIIINLLVLVTCLVQGDVARYKRIVWGTPLTDPNSYDVVGYYTWMARGDHWSYLAASISRLFTGDLPDPTPDSLTCGGALITTFVVQTACHCIARFQWFNATNFQPFALEVWEDWMSVWVGITVVDDMKEEGLWSKQYIIHQKCTIVWHGSDLMTHDYGLVVLNRPVNFRLLHQRPAPVFDKSGILKTYVQLMRTGAVCLFAGFGAYLWEKPGIPGQASPVLQHGWRVARPYWYCFWNVFINDDAFDGAVEKYGKTATWVCTAYFGKQRGTGLSGDSGSPVVCNNVYAGVVSFTDLLFKTEISINYFDSLAFALYENAVEYRQDLIDRLKQYVDTNFFPPDTPYTVRAKNNWGEFFEKGLTKKTKKFAQSNSCKQFVVNFVATFIVVFYRTL